MAKQRPAVHSPIGGTLATMFEALIAGIVVAIPTLFLPMFLPSDLLSLMYLGFAFLGAGALAGRASLAGFLGFAGGFIGITIASLVWFSVAAWLGRPLPLGDWHFYFALLFGALGGGGGAATGALGVRRVSRLVGGAPKSRVCQQCGSRVGLAARKCWSCRAVLRL